MHSTDGIFATETESWGGSKTTQTTSSRTTQQDGSSALTFAYINNCSVKIDPNNQGITLFELFVTIDYTAAAAGATVHSVNTVAEANIATIKGVAHANIAEVNTSATTTTLRALSSGLGGGVRSIRLTNTHASTAVMVSLFLEDGSSNKSYIVKTDIPSQTTLLLTEGLTYNTEVLSLKITTTAGGLGTTTPLSVIIK